MHIYMRAKLYDLGKRYSPKRVNVTHMNAVETKWRDPAGLLPELGRTNFICTGKDEEEKALLLNGIPLLVPRGAELDGGPGLRNRTR